MAKIAVIIPAYNAARTIERTVQSVLSQTFKELELWIVDDGSTDETPCLVDRLAMYDSRIHVIHQENGKCYAARVTALKQISTPYFAFADADDVLEPTLYEELYAFAEEHQLDVAQCGIYGRTMLQSHDLYLTRNDVVDHVARPYLIEGIDSFYVWDKLYRSNLASDLLDSHIMMYEDIMLNLQFFRNVSRYGFLHRGLYHYDINAGSSVSNFKMRNLDDLREIYQTRILLLESYGVSKNDSVHDKWLIKNIRNMLISATSSRGTTWKARIKNVRAVLEFKEFKDAMKRQRCFCNTRVAFMKCVIHLPVFFVIGVFVAAKKTHSILLFCGKISDFNACRLKISQTG